MLVVEIIEYCNFKCYFCAAKDIKEPVYMSLELFKRIILEAKALGITDLDMIPSKGEPFLHPDIYEMLDFANAHMKYITIFSNASAINVSKLQKTNLKNTSLSISYYGSTPEKFKELTAMDSKLFDIVHTRLSDLSKANIKYNLERRDINYKFSYAGTPRLNKFDFKVKCHFHTMPKIHADGRVTFCKFAKSNVPDNDAIYFANLHNKSLKEALEHPIRYKFMDSQSICANRCSSFELTCFKESIPSFKLMAVSKKQYLANPEPVDQQYREIESETTQPSI